MGDAEQINRSYSWKYWGPAISCAGVCAVAGKDCIVFFVAGLNPRAAAVGALLFSLVLLGCQWSYLVILYKNSDPGLMKLMEERKTTSWNVYMLANPGSTITVFIAQVILLYLYFD